MRGQRQSTRNTPPEYFGGIEPARAPARRKVAAVRERQADATGAPVGRPGGTGGACGAWNALMTLVASILAGSVGADAPPVPTPWQPPSSRRVGWKGLTAEQLRDLAFEDQTRDPLGT